MPDKKLYLTAITVILAISVPATANLPLLFLAPQALAQTPSNRKAEADQLLQQGIEQYQTSQFEAALQSWQQALIIYREIKDRLGEGQSLGNLGIAYYSLGDYAKAIDYQQQKLAIAREIKDRFGEGTALGDLGIAYDALGDYPKAIDYQQQSLAIAREIKDRFGEGLSLNNLGFAYQESGDLKQAEKTLRTGIEVLESLRGQLGKNDNYRVSIFEEQARTYRILQEVLIAQNQTDAALLISERGRARAFVELLTSRLSAHNQGNINPSLESNANKPTLSLLQQIAKQQNATLVEYSITSDYFKIQGKPETHESELYIWVIKPTGEVTFRKSDLKPLWQKQNTTLAELVTASRKSIGVIDARERGGIDVVAVVDQATQTKRLQQLHDILIKPLADLLPSQESERVIFIPQSSLFLVPFPALQDAKGKYLLEKHTILTAPSIQVLDLTHKQRLAPTPNLASRPTLVVGNPTMPKVILEPGKPAQQLNNLPWAEKEAKDIASILKTPAITGSQATKTAIIQKMPQARIIHLATHGILDDYRGVGSAVALAPSGKDDGLLTADEILNLKLNHTELVVLSACNTGGGRITGDGVIGLSRSLIGAGTPSVIVSLWSVDDNSTSFLMTEFYKNLQQKLDKATALRKAMLTTMQQKKYEIPLNWAAFTLIGEAE